MVARSTCSSVVSSAERTSQSKSHTTKPGDKMRGCESTAQPPDKRKRLAANARERKRMHLLNKAYDKLRKRLADAQNKSKYDVLVQAKEYIQALASICDNFDRQHPNQAKMPTQLVRASRVLNDLGEQEMDPSPSLEAMPQGEALDQAEQHPHQQNQRDPQTPVMIKLESPQSIASSCAGDRLSPISQSDSVISNCSTAENSLNRPPQHHQHYQHQTRHYINRTHQLHPPRPDALDCSALLSPPPSMPLPLASFAAYPQEMQQLAHEYLPKMEPCLMRHAADYSNRPEDRHSLAPTTTSQGLYNQYYQTLYHIQRAI